MARNARDPESVPLPDLLAEAFERKLGHGTNFAAPSAG